MTQEQLLLRIDAESRRALDAGENANVDAMLETFDLALDEVKSRIAAAWAELELTSGGGDPKRAAFLRWKAEREESVMRQIQSVLDRLRDNMTTTLRSGLVQTTVQQALWDSYAIDEATPPTLVVDTSVADPHTAEALVNEPWKGQLFSNRIWALTDDMAAEIQNQLAASVLRGESVAAAIRRIEDLDILDGNVPPRYAVERLVRTEMLAASDRARQLTYHRNKDLIEGEVPLVTLDNDTCENICAPLEEPPLLGQDLQSQDVQQHLAEEGARPRPPFHPNCRCSTLPVLRPWGELLGLTGEAPEDLDPASRVVRDETGRSRIGPMQTFEQWITGKRNREVVAA